MQGRFCQSHALRCAGRVAVLAMAAMLLSGCGPSKPTYVILMVGDGMGFEQLKAASLYAYGREDALTMQQMPVAATVTTHSAEGETSTTDSAAAATAMATGRKVERGVLSQRIPGPGDALETALEYHRDKGRMTGLVTTTFISHATPAAFGSHAVRRSLYSEIAGGYFKSRPNLLFGGVRGRNRQTKRPEGMTRRKAEAAGYTVLEDRLDLVSVKADPTLFLSGQFKTGHMAYEYDQAMGKTRSYDRAPRLSEMTREALRILASDPDGFFLLVEGGRIDHAGHANELERNIFETLEFDRTVGEVLRWADGRDDVLIIVTADHETGGLNVRTGRGIGRFPDVTWGTKGHTPVPVPVYAQGPGTEAIEGEIDNTDIYWLITNRPSRLRSWYNRVSLGVSVGAGVTISH